MVLMPQVFPGKKMVAQDYFAQKDQWLAEKKDLEDAVFCLKIAVSGQCVF